MCRLFIVASTVLPMLIHSILGCCWHHAHGSIPIGVCEKSDAELFAQAGSRKCCDHGYFEKKSRTEATLATGAASTELPTCDPCGPDDERFPCDEDRCVLAWTNSTKQKSGSSNWVVGAAIGGSRHFTHLQPTSCVRRHVEQRPHPDVVMPRAELQVWTV